MEGIWLVSRVGLGNALGFEALTWARGIAVAPRLRRDVSAVAVWEIACCWVGFEKSYDIMTCKVY